VAVYRERAIRGASMNSGGALKRGLKGIA